MCRDSCNRCSNSFSSKKINKTRDIKKNRELIRKKFEQKKSENKKKYSINFTS